MDLKTWVATVGPLAGVALGGWLASGLSRKQWMRDRNIGEVQLRRTQYAAFQKALWAYASRVVVARQLAAGRTDESQRIRFDIGSTKQRQEACRDAYADLTMFGNTGAQQAAFSAMEALTRSLEAVKRFDAEVSDRAFAEYEQAFTVFAEAVNRDVSQMNAMLYAFLTPWWRAVFDNKIRRRPLPFETYPMPEEPTALLSSDPDEEGLVP